MCACKHQIYRQWSGSNPRTKNHPAARRCVNSWLGVAKERGELHKAASARALQPGAEVTSLKRQLLQVVSRLNAAVAPAPEDTKALLACVQQLAQVNPTPQPETSTLMNGRWVLLYTSNAPGAAAVGSPQPADMQQQLLLQALSPFQAISGALYKVFYTYLPVLAGSATGRRGSIGAPSSMLPGPRDISSDSSASRERMLLRSRGNFQTFDLAAGTVVNEARFELLGSEASITVNGEAQVVDSTAAGKHRLRAMFTSFTFSVDGQQRLSLPLAVPNLLQGGALVGPVGYVDTCYLDNQLRISVGDKGSLFITIRDGAESALLT